MGGQQIASAGKMMRTRCRCCNFRRPRPTPSSCSASRLIMVGADAVVDIRKEL
jgi:hypothetical protein